MHHPAKAHRNGKSDLLESKVSMPRSPGDGASPEAGKRYERHRPEETETQMVQSHTLNELFSAGSRHDAHRPFVSKAV